MNANCEIELLEEEIRLLKRQNDILSRNTWFTGAGMIFGFAAILIALVALLK